MPVRRLQDGVEFEPEVRRPSRHDPGDQGEAVHQVLGASTWLSPPLAEERIASDEYILATPSCFDFSSLEQSRALSRGSDRATSIRRSEQSTISMLRSPGQTNHRGSKPENQPGDRARG
jgi:hypothetical protein